MPELPEVETVRRGLEPALTGQTIRSVELRRKDLRIPFPVDMRTRLEGAAILTVRRRSKYLLVETGKDTLIIHLGMSGRILLEKHGYLAKKHDHVLLGFSDGTLLVFNDARRFGLMTLCPTAELDNHKLFAELGPEPLSDDFSAEYLHSALKARNSPIKTALMDAKLVVGVGNIYASESLFRSFIHPARKTSSLTKKEASLLVPTIREVLQEAIDSGGSTLRDYVRSDGDLGYFQHKFRVYGRENKPCLTCATPIERLQQQGRSTFFCPRCQRR